MTLGEKIKQARLEAGLSQRQLCGDEITRNMLSQIENGSARPSMDTLTYFARRLDKPVGWFLEEEAVVSPNQQIIQKARQAYADADYAGVTEILESYKQPDVLFDDERWLLETVSLMELAREALTGEKGIYAAQLMDRAWQAGQKTPYFLLPLRREWALLMYEIQPEKAAEAEKRLPADDRECFLRAQAAMAAHQYAQASVILDSARVKNAYWHYLRGQSAQGQGEYALAVDHYLAAEEQYPQDCAGNLEECYRELEDYKMAYHYACKQRK